MNTFLSRWSIAYFLIFCFVGRPAAPPGGTSAPVHQQAPKNAPAPSSAHAASSIGKSHHSASGRESRNEQQYQMLTDRQKQLKLAAIKAKKEGALETARHYLRQAKGLEPMIEASANGLPVDVTAIPKAPPGIADESDDFEVSRVSLLVHRTNEATGV